LSNLQLIVELAAPASIVKNRNCIWVLDHQLHVEALAKAACELLDKGIHRPTLSYSRPVTSLHSRIHRLPRPALARRLDSYLQDRPCHIRIWQQCTTSLPACCRRHTGLSSPTSMQDGKPDWDMRSVPFTSSHYAAKASNSLRVLCTVHVQLTPKTSARV
jgi:hypothetical protein